ncbi:hypothetical protein SLE2022_307280 [Rubroshorea leprosula]
MATKSKLELGFFQFLYIPELMEGGGEETFLESDAKYAEELQYQEVLKISTDTSQLMIDNNHLPSAADSRETTGEFGESSQGFCEICVEKKENHQMIRIGSCFHSFCSDCIGRQVRRRIEVGRTTITCLGENCKAVLELEDFRPLLAKEVISLWEDALCREMIPHSERIFCPFEDCSAMFVIDNERGDIRQSECQFCHRLFCAKCGVPWHYGMRCEEYGKLDEDEKNKDDLMMRKLAEEQKWIRCPRCKFFVERIDGCPHMICRCEFQFCYLCGKEWTGDHVCCQGN